MGHLEVRALLEDAVSKRIGSGMAASFGNLRDLSRLDSAQEIFVGRTSHFSPSHPVTEHTFFDLSSLTKILATTTLAMKRHDQGKLDLDQDVSSLSYLKGITARHLLTHTSGLPAWKPFYEEMRTHFGPKLPYVNLVARKQKFDELLYAVPTEIPPLQKIVYSDLGFLILENFLSPHFKQEVESLWQSMGITGLHFRPVLSDSVSAHYLAEQQGESIAATENCPWRGLLVGQVHDDNAWSRGGATGHAGAFGRVKDLRSWIQTIFLGLELSKSTVQLFTKEAVQISGTRRALGFDMPNMDGSGSTGFSFSKHTVGHLGFTGTSLWVDLHSGDYAILLTNRVHPDRSDNRIRTLRREFHRLVRGN